MCKISCFTSVLVLWLCGVGISQTLDKTRYIGIDEIKPGMKAYCLTIYEGTKIEKFPLEVIDIARNIEPGRNAILVQGTDPRFEHTGPVAGCSGSPVYIEGRLAGALAFGWPFSKDALYGVTPIEEMHRAGEVEPLPQCSSNFAGLDFTKPIDLGEAADAIGNPKKMSTALPTGAGMLETVVATSTLPSETAAQLEKMGSAMGFVPVSGLGQGDPDPNLVKNTKFEPGSAIVVPMVDGDIKMAALGTVTDVDGDKIYAFGHSFLGQGSIELPIATGQVSTVVASLMRSFKFGSALEVKGALIADEATAIVGTTKKQARTIPLSIKIDRFNDSQVRTYKCRLASHEMISPTTLMTTLSAAATMRGPLPPEHSIYYKAKIGIDGLAPIEFENNSTGDEAAGMIKDGVGAIALLMNNPFKRVCISSLDFEAKILPKSILSHIWSVTVSDTTVKAGGTVDITTVVEPYLAAKQTYRQSIKIPENTKPGDYELLVTGADGYGSFLRKAAPERFVAEDLDTLVSAIRSIAEIRRDRLYYVLQMPAGGVTIESEQLRDLPASKAMMLRDDKRTITMQPAMNWIQKDVATDSIVSDAKTVKITVEQ
jgi:hypothetical protein